MTKALEDFIAAYCAPKVAVQTASDFACTEWVHDGEHGWTPCAGRKTSRWGDCPNKASHGRPVLQHKELDEITEGDHVNFYHPASNRDQWATVLEWTPVKRRACKHFPEGCPPDGCRYCDPLEWDAVLHISDLGLGNGFTAGITVQRHRVSRYGSIVKYACTPGVFR